MEAVDGQAEVWNPDVHFFLLKKDGKPKAYCYLVRALAVQPSPVSIRALEGFCCSALLTSVLQLYQGGALALVCTSRQL